MTVHAVSAAISGAFDIKDIGRAVCFLGLERTRDRTRWLPWHEQPNDAQHGTGHGTMAGVRGKHSRMCVRMQCVWALCCN